ncbi:hypothetical protein [Cupriavidus numazuensis]|uniref:DUF2306 domain-containing protein n=1 Tax=Cupriavidus numazuensis TaxID=221992 RepID=A0ABM8TSC3_9BURK|nr:hypothetical protein [Cupriavidus numazuensis]CAG2159221.1 hypothetical protein LMG26411_06534 [Cupriavidus numazuensis]
MYGLTQLGVVHTLISLVALACGVLSLCRSGVIRVYTPLGRGYVWMTVLTCLTGFGIFQHGGFGAPHVLGIITLLVLALAAYAARGVFGRAGQYVEVIALSLTVFFHFIPGVTETTTRLPLGAPLLPNADAPELKAIVGMLFLVFLVGATLQYRYLRRQASGAPSVLPGKVA